MPHLCLTADAIQPGEPDYAPVHLRKDFQLIRALGTFRQKPRFLFRRQMDFVRIGKQLVRLAVRQHKAVHRRLSVRCRAAAQDAFPAVFQLYHLSVLHVCFPVFPCEYDPVISAPYPRKRTTQFVSNRWTIP